MVDAARFKECNRVVDSQRKIRKSDGESYETHLLCCILNHKVLLDHISYPVNTSVPKHIQCRRCWIFAHSSLVCTHDLGICE